MKALCCRSSCCSPYLWRCLGALGAQWLRGLQNDVYCQIGLVMLVGLSSKNAILIVEFAEQLRHRGMPLLEATVEAATHPAAARS